MKIKYAMLGLASAMLIGCGATELETSDVVAKNTTNEKEHDGVVCKLEKRVGSNMMYKVCRTAEERAAEQEAGREGMLRLQRTSMTSGADQ